MFTRIFILLVVISTVCQEAISQENDHYIVQLNEVKAAIPSTLWGIFFEDVNRAGDGGLSAEMIINGSFEFYKSRMGWKMLEERSQFGVLVLQNREAEKISNPRYLQVDLPKTGKAGIVNDGFGGMVFKKGLQYNFSMKYRIHQPGLKIIIQLLNRAGEPVADTSFVPAKNGQWSECSIGLISKDTSSKGKCRIWFEGEGKMDIDMLSLFPSDTWKKQPNGLRNDLASLMSEMKPGFLRFPGGCIIEGDRISERYQWKKTIGPMDQRQLIINSWNSRAVGRENPSYFQSFRLGFLEYFKLCEDI
ncbi:MAG: alpha-L-arabinofuranosidase, partial [Flavitalea sp.]